ncbi:oligosaccharide flippase family protein [Chitinophaga arvensicola]|uniref:Membrane protein involved in the export of O-antigen and teichoic acid n=1 Tax=Chitinophaga arvensicola TaxID=29529 RepID=A0A1I0S8E6_9BACT|nr:oligosaccharide flippase family protein [Chitinophaga arvensicola]SEW52407.1 Membrane protein involved in the export of O-antigen and teichoic acid [Chitinophaga arvensicola]
MGVVKHQSIKSSLLIYLGFAIGGINTVLLFPHFFTGDQFGLTRIFFDLGLIMVPFCTFSTGTMMNRYYPYYSTHLSEKKNDLLTWVFLISLLGFLLFVGGTFIFKGLIVRKYNTNSPLFIDYFYLLYPAVFGLVMYTVFESYSWSRHETVLSNSLKELGVRIFTTFLIVLYVFKWISFPVFMWLFSLSYFFALLVLLICLRRKNLLHFTFRISSVTRRMYKRMGVYSGTVMSATLFFVVAQNVDSLIISSFKGLNQAAYLSIATYMATLIQVPQRSIASIATPVMAQAWKDKDISKIDEIYKKSAILQLVAALFIFLFIWLNIDNIYKMMPAEYSVAKYVVFYLGVAKVIDMGTGANQQLLSTSRLWYFELVSSTLLVAMSIPLNYFLIREYGITGSGYALLISMFTFNTIRYIFIWIRFGLQPFSLNTLKAIGISAVVYFACHYALPDLGNLYINILLSGICFTLLFVSGILILRVSEDINSTFFSVLRKITARNRS